MQAQRAGQGEAVGVGQADIQHHDLGALALHPLLQFRAGAAAVGGEAEAAQARHQDAIAQYRIVLQDQSAQGGGSGIGSHAQPQCSRSRPLARA
ncbi:hypothetical protein NB689_002504 [Xanthomonas sacchari]|nr:hypothetical protein [Xanthomonas sacchari]